MDKDTTKELQKELVRIRLSLKPLIRRFGSWHRVFLLGVIQGMGVVVGATALVIFVSWFVSVLGLVPGLGDLAESIQELLNYAAERR